MMNEKEIEEFLEGVGDNARVIKKINLPQLEPGASVNQMSIGINYLSDVPMTVSAELGSCSIKVKELLSLEKGSVLKLDKPAGELIEIHLNGQCFAHGEVVVIGNNFGLRVDSINMPEANIGAKADG